MYAGRMYQMLAFDDRLPPNGCGEGHVTRFVKIFSPNHVFGIAEARHFKFRVLFDSGVLLHDILPPKGMCSESRDLLRFWELSDNIISWKQ